MHFVFVSTRRGSSFMTELLTAISAAAAAAGHTSEFVLDEFPALRGGSAYVVIPHEFHAWGNPAGFPDARQRARTIALCTENPGTEWFEATCQLLPEFAAAVSINRSSASELTKRGIRCEHIQLGYAPMWDTWNRDESVERPIDVLYLGAADTRRDPLLAGLGGGLWAHTCQFLIPPLEERTGPRPDFLKGTDKFHRLRSAKILLNLHRTTSAALEWMRFLEAICNGCVVVSEPSLDGEPLRQGEHFLSASAGDIPGVIDLLLDDPDRIRLLRRDSYDFVRAELPMGPAVDRLAGLAQELPRLPASTEESRFTRAVPTPDASSQAEASPHAAHSDAAPAPGQGPIGIPLRAPGPRRLLRNTFTRLLGGPDTGLRMVAQSDTYTSMRPRVSVVLVLTADRAPGPMAGLASIAASLYKELEVLVLIDASGARGPVTPCHLLEDHARLAAIFLHQPAPRGLGHSRNALIERARGEYVFVLDSHAGIYPSALERLVTVLDADPRATFSYPMIAIFDKGEPVELLGSMPWEPERLTKENWIDGMALIRRKRLQQLGGYSTDPRLTGWEDFDLWCKVAESGGHAAHVPQVLGWRQRAGDPVPAQVETEAPERWTLLRERFPGVFAPPTAA